MLNIYFQVAGLVIILIVFLIFLSQKKINLKTTRQLISLSIMSIINLGLDIFSLCLIHYYENAIFTEIVCKTYLISIVGLSFVATDYVLYDIVKPNIGLYHKMIKILVPIMGVLSFAIYFIPINIKNNPGFGKDYTDGAAIYYTYVIAILMLFATFVQTIVKRKQMNKRRARAVRAWILVWTIMALIQLLVNYVIDTNHNLLLVGFGCAVGVLILYITLENHGFYQNKVLGVLNKVCAMDYVDELYLRKINFSLLFIFFDHKSKELSQFETNKSIMIEISNKLDSIKGGYVFKYEGDSLIVLRKDNFFEEYLKIINEEYEYLNPTIVQIVNPYSVDKSIKLFDIAQDINFGKYRNGNKYVLCDDEFIQNIRDKINYEIRIKNIIKEEKILVYYQPIFSIKDNRFTSAEALVRLQDDNGDVINPANFIDYAEETGLIVDIGKNVFINVCDMLNKFDIREYGMNYIEVNLSIVQLNIDGFAEDFINIMKEKNIDPSLINFEITESSYSKSVYVLENINKLIDYGSKFSLDDFGTGSSNLEYIVNMPVNIIKFDKMMVNSYFKNESTKVVINDIIKMIKALKLEIVFEGVEDSNQLEGSKNLGVDFVQGFYYSRPICEEDFITFIKTNNEK